MILGVTLFCKGVRFCESEQRKDVEMNVLGSKEGSPSNSIVNEASKIISCIDFKKNAHQPSELNNDVNNV